MLHQILAQYEIQKWPNWMLVLYVGGKSYLLAHVRRWKSDSMFFKQLRKHFELVDITAEIQTGAALLSSHTRGASRLFQLTAKRL